MDSRACHHRHFDAAPFLDSLQFFLATPHPLLGPLIADALLVIFSYDAPSAQVLRKNLLAVLSGIPRNEHPDFVVVLGKYVVRGGSYLEISKFGQPGSPFRQALFQQHGANLESLLPIPIEMGDFQENALFSWFIWFQSWLKQAGPRQADLLAYLPPDAILGQTVV